VRWLAWQPAAMSPFVRPDSPRLNDMLADGAVALFRERGVDALNVAALARWMGVSRQALSERLWDPEGSRRRIMQLTVRAFADRWIAWVRLALREDPPVPALPRSAEEVHGVRVWAGLLELARGERASGNPDPAAAVTATLVREREIVGDRVAYWIGAEPAADDLTELVALTDGLRSALIEPMPKVTYDQARSLLLRRLNAMHDAVSDGAGPGGDPDPQAA